NSPREKVGKPKEFETLGNFPVAIGRSARTTVLVSIDPATRTLTLARFGRRRNGCWEGAYSFVDPGISPVFQSDRLSLCAWHAIAGWKEGFYLLDDAGSLLRLFLDPDGRRWCDCARSDVLALTLVPSGMCYAAYDPSGGGEVSVYLNDHNVPVQSWPSAAAPTRAFLGYATPPFGPSAGLLALEYANSQWEICVGQNHTPVAVPQNFSVHGVVRDTSYEETLIAVDQELPTLVLHGAHGTRPLVRASTGITAVCGCPQRPLIACGTDTGE